MNPELTTFTATDAFAGLTVFADTAPNGLAKEIVVRAAAVGLLNEVTAEYLASIYNSLVPDVAGAVAAGTGVVNAAVKRLVAIGAVPVVAGEPQTETIARLAGAICNVVDGKSLNVTETPKAERPVEPVPALSGLDLCGPECATLRLVLTRTLASVRPDLFAQYRAIKDSGTATARADAYRFVFGLLAELIENDECYGAV